jgi:phosphoribosylamine--glycine ligase/phosphoribosylformylglycinamidine cyclo-ligase
VGFLAVCLFAVIFLDELSRTFNCGIGMVLIVAKEDVKAVRKIIDAQPSTPGVDSKLYELGSVVANEDGESLVEMIGAEAAWV